MRTKYLLCVLLGVVLSTVIFEARDAYNAVQALGQRVDRIETYLGELSHAMSR